MRIKKTSQYIEGGAGLPSYFTTETDTGMKWIDGKTIYSKTFTYTNLSQITSGSYDTINTSLSNVSIVKIEAINTNSNLGLTRMLPYTDNTNLLRVITVSNGQYIRLYVDGTMFTSNDDAIVTLFYTK